MPPLLVSSMLPAATGISRHCFGPIPNTSRVTSGWSAAFLQHWLDSPQADNARQSLAGEAALRCVALVASMEGPAAAMLRTLEETRGEQLRAGLTLPEEIDAVVVITDAEVLDYGLV